MNNYVLVNMTNGFGNNIFQYTAARLLATFHKKEVYANPPWEDYYGISDLEKLGIKFSEQKANNEVLYISDQNYLHAFDEKYSDRNFILTGYFEDYRYYLNQREMIKNWFPNVQERSRDDLVVHMRTGDRLFMKNEFYSKPRAKNYLEAIEQFDFKNLYIVTDMPKWDYVTADELQGMKIHLNVPDNERVPIQESVKFFNEFVDGFKKYSPIVERRSVGEDFDFIRSFKNILFEHGTLSWWAAFLSDADKVGVYGPWRPFKGNKNKNLSQIPLDNWFKWE